MNKMPLCPPEPPQFLSHVPSRWSHSGGRWKFHHKRHHAVAAVDNAGKEPAAYFQWDEEVKVWALQFANPSYVTKVIKIKENIA